MKIIRNIIITILLIIGVRWMYDTNMNIGFSRYEISYTSLPKEFANYKIGHISDFHNTMNQKITSTLINGLREEKPDIIVITGDLIDSRNPNMDVAFQLIEKLVEIAPCYYVTGNHESRLLSDEFQRFVEGLEQRGAVVLNDREIVLSNGEAKVSLIGVYDPMFSEVSAGKIARLTSEKINNLKTEDTFSILLSHRPEFYETYKQADVNLVFSGHAHGGQFRLPFIGGLIAPNQGFFPKYDSGVYQEDDFALVVSRGVGNSLLPIRFNNQPEIIIVQLKQS